MENIENMEKRFDVVTDCGTLIASNVTRSEALEYLVKGLSSDCLHFHYLTYEHKVKE